MRHTLQLTLPTEAEGEDLLKWSIADPSGLRYPSKGSITIELSGSLSTLNLLRASCIMNYRAVDHRVYKWTNTKDFFTLLNETFKRKWDSIRELEPIWYIRERRGGTFEKWYSSGNNILRDRFPSLDEPPSTVTVTVSADDRLLRRLKDLEFCTGGWTPFSSKVRSSASSLFKSRYLITLLFVSAMKSLPAKWQEPLPL